MLGAVCDSRFLLCFNQPQGDEFLFCSCKFWQQIAKKNKDSVQGKRKSKADGDDKYSKKNTKNTKHSFLDQWSDVM